MLLCAMHCGKAMDVTGCAKATICGMAFDMVRLMDAMVCDERVVSEWFIEGNGRTALWRRVNRNDWKAEHYDGLWTELLPDNERLAVNGEVDVHWYDCITDCVFGLAVYSGYCAELAGRFNALG